MKIKRLFIMLLICMGVCDAIAQTTLLSKSDYLDNFIGQKVIVRNYQDSIEVICAYGAPNNTGPSGDRTNQTTFFIRHMNNGNVVRIGKLPEYFYVNDVQFVSLYKRTQSQYVDFCVFCGRRDSLIREYYLPSISGPSILVQEFDTAGIVGLFYMDDARNPQTGDNIMVRKVEDTKELKRMTAYAESNGQYFNTCQRIYRDNAVIDAIGTADSTWGWASCFTRVKFYPSCNGEVRWDNNIRTPSEENETMIDVISNDNYVVTASKIKTNNTVIWLRWNDIEDHLVSGGIELSVVPRQLGLNTITVNSSGVGTPHYVDSILLCKMRGDTCSISFRAVSEDNNNVEIDGILSYKMTGPTCTIHQGMYDKGISDLYSVTYMPNSNTTALLYKHTVSPQMYGIRLFKWIQTFPIYSFTESYARNLQSITHYTSSGNEYLHIGGYSLPSNYVKLKLIEHKNFNTLLNNNCFPTSSDQGVTSNINKTNMLSSFPIRNRFPHDPQNYPLISIPMTSVTEAYINMCTSTY